MCPQLAGARIGQGPTQKSGILGVNLQAVQSYRRKGEHSPRAPEVAFKEDDMQKFPSVALAMLTVWTVTIGLAARQARAPQDLDAMVTKFLDQRRSDWQDMNVPESDGQQLHDLVAKGRYTRALEIGTSTGRSGIWIAWALSKTGGRLVTIDIDRGRHEAAARNFQDAGVAAFVDARLADAHDLVPSLAGPFDFVFIDADKEWYTNYAKAVIPKLTVGGCLTAHNVYPDRGRRGSMTGDFYEYLSGLPFMETTVTPGGLAVSYKRREK
jgi:caffeoyl-CoA O-methyltransferase